MNILIIFIYNPNALTSGGNFDTRYDIFKKLAYYLKEKKHNIFISPCDDGTKIHKEELKNFPVINYNKYNKKLDLIIGWNPGMVKRNTRKLFPNIPIISYENGHMKDSVIIDPKGLIEESFYTNILNDECEREYDEEKCIKFINNSISQNTSKRPQPKEIDIPGEINNKYVFIPMQKINDISLKKSKIGMIECVEKTSKFCHYKKIPLVIKIHPHVGGDEKKNQLQLVTRMKKKYKDIYLSSSSINYLMKNSRFTVTITSASIMDNFLNNTPVLVLSRCLYSSTQAVIYSEDIMKGLYKIFNREYDEELMFQKQKKLIWWYLKNNLFDSNSIETNYNNLFKHINKHIN